MVVFLGCFACLAALCAPGLYLRDAGELSTAAFTLGVAHETGFSFYCLLGKLACLLPLGEVAFRVNLLSAATGALAATFVYFAVRDALAQSGVWVARTAGAIAAAMVTADLDFFRSATQAEVYAPTAAALAIALYLIPRVARGDRPAGLMLALLGGLSLGLHGSFRLLMGPPVILLTLLRLRRGDRWPLYGLLFVALGASVIAYLPLRASRDPAANWAAPRTLTQVVDHLQAARIRRAYAGQMLSHNTVKIADAARTFGSALESEVGVLALALALFGLGAMKPRWAGIVAATVLAGDIVYSVWINPMGLEDSQNGTPTVLVLAVLCGVGAGAIGRKFGRAGPFITGAAGAIALVQVVLVGGGAGRFYGWQATAWSRAALEPAAPRALVITGSDDLSGGTLYEQVVGGRRPDVTVLVRQQLWDPDLVKQRIRRAGGGVHGVDRFFSLPAAKWLEREAELLPALLQGEIHRREVWCEPDANQPPVGVIQYGVPTCRMGGDPSAPPKGLDAGAAAQLTEQLLMPSTDDQVRRLAATTLVQLGRLWLTGGNEREAVTEFEAALRMRPHDAAALTQPRGDRRAARGVVESGGARGSSLTARPRSASGANERRALPPTARGDRRGPTAFHGGEGARTRRLRAAHWARMGGTGQRRAQRRSVLAF